MVDNPIITALITAAALIVGNVMNPLFTYWMEGRRNKRETEKAQRDKEDREIENRDKAYIQFLSITEEQVTDTDEDLNEFFRLGNVEGIIALAFRYGTPKISSIIQSAYPITDWKTLELVKKAIMKELILEKGEKNMVQLKGPIVIESGMKAGLDKVK